jgi:uncharacterized protein YceH (UPF0502 family)
MTGAADYQPRTHPAPSAEARVIDLAKRVEALERQVFDLTHNLDELVSALLSAYTA